MTDEPERDFMQEAKNIMAGHSSLLCELQHLEAVEELRQITLIKIANALEALKREVLNT